jgi:organic radical activating enzyme
MPAYFIRFQGCSVRCVFCDEKRTWKFAPDKTVSLNTLAEAINAAKPPLVVITGGEPCEYPDLRAFMAKLRMLCPRPFYQLETSGYLLDEITLRLFEAVCLSPKIGEEVTQKDYYQTLEFDKLVLEYSRGIYFKLVVRTVADYRRFFDVLPILKHTDSLIYIHPEADVPSGDIDKEAFSEIIRYVLEHEHPSIALRIRFGLQVHKILGFK